LHQEQAKFSRHAFQE